MTPPIGRICDQATFRALQRSSRRSRSGALTVTWVPGGSWHAPRVAYAIGRKVGGAVQRNRVRRRLRAILAERAPAMPAGSYLVSVSPKASTSSFAELRTNLYEALEALSRQGPR